MNEGMGGDFEHSHSLRLSDLAVHEELVKCCQTAVDNHQLSDQLTVNDAHISASNDTYISEQSCLQC